MRRNAKSSPPLVWDSHRLLLYGDEGAQGSPRLKSSSPIRERIEIQREERALEFRGEGLSPKGQRKGQFYSADKNLK